MAARDCEFRWRYFKSILYNNIVNELIKVRSLALRGPGCGAGNAR